MALEKKVRCPYCQKVFLWRVKPLREGQGTVNLTCPYCKEQLALKKEALLKG